MNFILRVTLLRFSQQLLSLSSFSPCATAAAEEPFWGLMHSTAGGAKPRMGVGGGEKKGSARSSVYRAVETWDTEHIGRQARNHMAKQEHYFTRITLPGADLKSHLNSSYNRPITQTTV